MPQQKTSFIPKKTLEGSATHTVNVLRGRKTGQPVDFILFVALIFFILTLAAAIAVFMYEYKVKHDIHTASVQLETAQKSINPQLIAQLKSLDRQMSVASDILKDHEALTPFFDSLEQSTLRNVQFTSFNYSLDEKGVHHIEMHGLAKDYQTVALQSSIFANAGIIENSHFKNLGPGDKANGYIKFLIVADVNPSIFKYEGASPSAGTAPAGQPQTKQ